jgi:hypothetical protein
MAVRVDCARDDGCAGAVDDPSTLEPVADRRDPPTRHGDVGAAELPRTDVDNPVAENELRRHYAPAGAATVAGPESASLAMSTIASPGTFAASAGLLKASNCFAFDAVRTSATSAM